MCKSDAHFVLCNCGYHGQYKQCPKSYYLGALCLVDTRCTCAMSCCDNLSACSVAVCLLLPACYADLHRRSHSACTVILVRILWKTPIRNAKSTRKLCKSTKIHGYLRRPTAHSKTQGGHLLTTTQMPAGKALAGAHAPPRRLH